FSVNTWRLVAPVTNPNIVPSTNPANTMGDYKVDPTTGTNIFQWELRQGDTSMAGTATPPSKVPPTVNAGSAQTIALPTSTVTLSEVSTAYNGAKLVSILWSEVSGPNTANITGPKGTPTTATGLIAGTYVFKLTATDNNGRTGSGQVSITVKAAATSQQAPIVNAGTAQTITLPTSSVTLNGVSTPAPGTSLTAIQWASVSGPNTPDISA